jgi:hypothetical protein
MTCPGTTPDWSRAIFFDRVQEGSPVCPPPLSSHHFGYANTAMDSQITSTANHITPVMASNPRWRTPIPHDDSNLLYGNVAAA